ncbi:hypothetical protein ACHSBP_09625 [Pseudoalteromonas sp. XMcav1-K]|uniref:hypothetical protein n=1 Tax=Pseudoalteromonas sp. XMcav1-K TaxID=3374372 RepID=UPI003757C73D
MQRGIDINSALTLREILLRDISLEEASKEAREVLNKEKIEISQDVSERVSSVLKNAITTESPSVVDELSQYFSKVVNDGKYVSQLVSAPAPLSQKLGVELSEESIQFLSDIDVKSMFDEETLRLTKEHLDGRSLSFEPGIILGPDDGPRIPFPRQNPNDPPIQIDPYGPYAGIGTASVIIAVAIGVILAKNVDRTAGPRVLDYSGLERL